MALRKLVRKNHGEESSVSIKYQNLHSFKKGMILLCQSILETRRISHFQDSALFREGANWTSPKTQSPEGLGIIN